jgi:indolepyruvate ferredoxin oxidoreductase beta subunit
MADQRPYPDEGLAFLEGKGFRVETVEATKKAIELGNYRAANVILLGALAAHLDIPSEVWEKTLEERIPDRILALNREAFAAGREMVPGPV